MFRRVGLWCSLGLLGGWAPCLGLAQAEGPPAVAVFDIKNRKSVLGPESLDRLGDYLAVRLAATGAFRVVPRAKLREQLAKKKVESYQDGFDRRFQVELGTEVAAQKTVAAQVMLVGAECVLTATLYDLKAAASDTAGICSGPCTEEGIKQSIDSVAAQLSGKGQLPDAWRMSPDLISAKGLELKVWTDRGPSGAYLQGEQVFVFLQANRDCFVRLIYEQVDGTRVQIFPNAFYNDYRIRGQKVWSVPGVNDNFEFEVSPPFGLERITAYASTEPFPAPEGTVTDAGMLVIDERVENRAILVKKAREQTATATASVTTAPRKTPGRP
jgi:hypothetical protein